MKNLTIVAGMALIVGGIVYFAPGGSIEYVTNTETVEVMPEWAENEEAVEAAQAVIRRQALEAELATLETEVAERQSRIDEIEKELGTY